MTIKDIARESGYAVGTVSRVINHNPNVSDAARARILEVIEKYHFQPNANAKHLKQQANQGIAMIVKGTHNMLFASVLEKMQMECSAAGYTSMVFYIDENDNEVDRARQICREHKPHGIIFLGSDRNHFGPDLVELGVPCLLMTNTAATAAIPNLSSVSVDDVAAAACMVRNLLDNGHRRIGFIGGNLLSSQPSSARLSGCINEFSRHGLTLDPEKQYVAARFTLQGGYIAIKQLLETMPDLTAVFAFSDIMAIGAMRALRDQRLYVPVNVSVCGFDGIELTDYLARRLTTIRQPVDQMAARGVSILIRCIEEGCDAVHELVPYELLTRESVRRLPDTNKTH